MLFMNTICESFPNVNLDAGSRSQFTTYTDPIMTSLVEKLGDNLQKIRTSAEDALMGASSHKEFGIRMVLSYLTAEISANAKPKVKGGKKPIISNKLIIAKY